jgi:cytochrome c oxidase cbb3-type subunit IV
LRRAIRSSHLAPQSGACGVVPLLSLSRLRLNFLPTLKFTIMLKFIKGHMTSLDGIEIYPIITLLLFMTIFLGAIYLAFRAKKSHISEMGELPFHDGSSDDNFNTPANNPLH